MPVVLTGKHNGIAWKPLGGSYSRVHVDVGGLLPYVYLLPTKYYRFYIDDNY